jgi:beta-glucanase (GH16 family)
VILFAALLLATTAHADPPKGYRLAWEDNFDGNRLDETKWTPERCLRRGHPLTADAVSVRGGVLTITTYTEGGKHYTGFLSTKGKFEPTYGYFEARIRFRSSPGQWGAFWLHSPTIGRPVGDPAAAGTEIDIVEYRARDRAGADVSDLLAMNLHWDGYRPKVHKHVGHDTRVPPGRPSLQGHWHTYALLWTPEGYTFFLDGVEQWRTDQAVSRRGEFLLLTCEIEDNSWAGKIPAGGYGPRAASRTTMEVDWVRVWQKPRAEGGPKDNERGGAGPGLRRAVPRVTSRPRSCPGTLYIEGGSP